MYNNEYFETMKKNFNRGDSLAIPVKGKTVLLTKSKDEGELLHVNLFMYSENQPYKMTLIGELNIEGMARECNRQSMDFVNTFMYVLKRRVREVS